MDNIFNWWKLTDDDKKEKEIIQSKKTKKPITIIETTKPRVVPDLETFAESVLSARSRDWQDRQLLYSQYWNTMYLDSWVSSLINKRLDSVNDFNVQLYKGDEIVDTGEFFKSPKFKKFMKDIILKDFWGFQVFQFDVDEYKGHPWFDYAILDHSHFNPYKKEVLERSWDKIGKPLDFYDNSIFYGDEDDLGHLLQITKISIIKTTMESFRLRYSELASENFIVNRYKTYSQDSLRQLEDAIENRGRGGVLSVPSDTNITTENQSSSSQNQLFKDGLDDYKKELSILILGQTMTTQDGSSRSQAEVHSAEQDDKFSSDYNRVLDFLNYEFIDFLKLWGLSGDNFKIELNNKNDIKERLALYKQLKDLDYVFSQELLDEKFKDIL